MKHKAEGPPPKSDPIAERTLRAAQAVHEAERLAYLGIAYGALVPMLVEAVKELTAKVNSLEQQLASK